MRIPTQWLVISKTKIIAKRGIKTIKELADFVKQKVTRLKNVSNIAKKILIIKSGVCFVDHHYMF